jgi:hypothetical protein
LNELIDYENENVDIVHNKDGLNNDTEFVNTGYEYNENEFGYLNNNYER